MSLEKRSENQLTRRTIRRQTTGCVEVIVGVYTSPISVIHPLWGIVSAGLVASGMRRIMRAQQAEVQAWARRKVK